MVLLHLMKGGGFNALVAHASWAGGTPLPSCGLGRTLRETHGALKYKLATTSVLKASVRNALYLNLVRTSIKMLLRIQQAFENAMVELWWKTFKFCQNVKSNI